MTGRGELSDSDLDAAYAARQRGECDSAIAICRRILAIDPTDQGARSLIGLCTAETGQVEQARPLIEQAVAVEPGNWRFLLNLSVLREIEGRVDAASNCAREAADIAPTRFEAWGRLGILCGKQGDFEGAVAALDKALAITSGHPGLALLLANAAYKIGNYDKSAEALDMVELAAPDRPETLELRTHLARQRGDLGALIKAATKWLAADSKSEAARVALAYGHAQQDKYHRAVETYRPLAQSHADHADHAATFARYLLWARDFEAADQHYRRALALEPDHAEAAAGLARLSIYKGHLTDAAAFARKAIDSDPNNADAYGQLALATDSMLSDAQLHQLHAMADDPLLTAEQRAVALFTAGDVHHRRKEYDAAFNAWTQANAAKQCSAAQSWGSSYDRRETEDLIDRLMSTFREFSPRPQPVLEAGPTPIFIVGMPRSGTTLLDSALSGHAAISSGGELPAMPSALNSFLEWAQGARWSGGSVPAAVADQLREKYRRQYAAYRIADAAFVTDKQPLNFLSVGLIRHLFPSAPIIHMLRNPLETGFSIYRKNLTRYWSFSTSLGDIGHYYGQYSRLITHWQAALGDEIATVRYETLVRDFEGELRRLMAHIGVRWDPDCLAYHQRESIVTTLSATQVRKAPSAEHIGSTKPYARALEPLQAALDEAGVDYW